MGLTEKGRAMTDHKTEHHAMSVSTFLLMFFASCALCVASIAPANAAADSSDASTTFHTKCEMCHGPDGAGSELGKSLHVPDLRSLAVQKLPSAQLAQIISDGKAGMPPFKSSLSEDQIHSLVAHIRTLRAKK
jgi:cytochrome c553